MKTKHELELYLHIPFCVKKCNYCDFLSFSADEQIQREYAKALMREIEYYGSLMGERRVSTIYIGGGTPSWLDSDLLIRILDCVCRNFSVSQDAEISMECNPGTITREKMGDYRNAGINRLSIGLQSANGEELRMLGRIHTYEQFLKTYELARNCGFSNVSVDLMSGLPYQTWEKFAKTLHQVVRLKPEHLSVYTLMIEKGTPFYEQYKFDAVKQEAGMDTEVLPNEEEAYRMMKGTQEILARAGYEQYEISNFAKPGFACRHNVGYWTRENYLGMGLGAASLIDNVRYRNVTDIYSYIEESAHIGLKELAYTRRENGKTVDRMVMGTCLHEAGEVLSRKSQMEEFMFLGLRMREGTSRSAFEQEFGISIDGVYGEVLQKLREEELLEVQAGRIKLTERGMDLGNYCMAQFLLEEA